MPRSRRPKYAPVGARVRDGYWGDEYTVLEHVPDAGDWRGEQVRIRWETGPSAGQERVHSTWFDPKRDRILVDAAAFVAPRVAGTPRSI